VHIPADAVINIRFAAANRDERTYDRADEIDLDRRNLRQHLAFGVGTHYCLGAPLARRELFLGFRALLDRVDDLWFVDGANDFGVAPNFCLRALKELHIGFRPAVATG
jgi:cytochrome P450